MSMNADVISLETAVAMTGLSRSTWRRRIAKGEVFRMTDDARGRTMLLWAVVKPDIQVPLAPEDEHLVFLADAGNTEAQNDVGQLFLMADKPKTAFYWFQQAAQQSSADAMQWLGHCYIHGKGVSRDDNVGIMWISKAASLGHVIAQGQMTGLISNALGSPPGQNR